MDIYIYNKYYIQYGVKALEIIFLSLLRSDPVRISTEMFYKSCLIVKKNCFHSTRVYSEYYIEFCTRDYAVTKFVFCILKYCKCISQGIVGIIQGIVR